MKQEHETIVVHKTHIKLMDHEFSLDSKLAVDEFGSKAVDMTTDEILYKIAERFDAVGVFTDPNEIGFYVECQGTLQHKMAHYKVSKKLIHDCQNIVGSTGRATELNTESIYKILHAIHKKENRDK